MSKKPNGRSKKRTVEETETPYSLSSDQTMEASVHLEEPAKQKHKSEQPELDPSPPTDLKDLPNLSAKIAPTSNVTEVGQIQGTIVPAQQTLPIIDATLVSSTPHHTPLVRLSSATLEQATPHTGLIDGRSAANSTTPLSRRPERRKSVLSYTPLPLRSTRTPKLANPSTRGFLPLTKRGFPTPLLFTKRATATEKPKPSLEQGLPTDTKVAVPQRTKSRGKRIPLLTPPTPEEIKLCIEMDRRVYRRK